MSTEDSKSLNRRWIQAFNERNWSTEAACRTADFRAHVSGSADVLDAASWGGFMGAFAVGFPDARISVDDDVSERDVVATRWTITGTHRGEFQGVPPTGRPVSMCGIDFSRIVGGKIAEHWVQFDMMAVMQQIGAIPAR